MLFTRKIILSFVIMMNLFCVSAQNDTTPIPHGTLREKWMWPHRRIARFIIREIPVFYDTSYIKAYKKNLVVTLPVSTRLLDLGLYDNVAGTYLKFAPNVHYDLGLSVNSRWGSFLINTGIQFSTKDNTIMGKTIFRDYQFNRYSKRFTTDLNLQLYQGFYVQNTQVLLSNTTSKEPYEIRPDVSAFSLGVSTTYIMNYKKFSYRSSFAFTEKQLKSAGSLLLGGYFSLLTTNAAGSLVSDQFKPLFDTSAYIRQSLTQNVGMNVGYIYTFVIKKKFYVTASMVQGIGVNKLYTLSETGYNTNYKLKFSTKLNLRVAAGYDNGRFFGGTMAIYDNFSYAAASEMSFEYGIGKFRVFVGYRFDFVNSERKFMRKLKLIDWDKPESK